MFKKQQCNEVGNTNFKKQTIHFNENYYHLPSAVCKPISSLYSPSPVLLNAFTRALYIELKCRPSTVQMVSFPQ